MKPVTTLGETRTPDGSTFSLMSHDGEYFLRLNGTQLMSTTWILSEELLADVACPKGRRDSPRVLIGGLGLGFSLKRTLEIVGPKAQVVQAELLPDVVRWNRELLQDVNGKLLDDPRVLIHTGDVYDCIVNAKGSSRYDAIILDVDNGSTSLVQPQNSQLYDRKGFEMIRRSLNPKGRVAFWTAEPEPAFQKQFRKEGFEVEEIPCKAHPRGKRYPHRIYVGQLRD